MKGGFMLRGIFAFIMLVTLVGCTGQSQTGVNPETPQPIAPSTSVGQVEQTAELPVTGNLQQSQRLKNRS